VFLDRVAAGLSQSGSRFTAVDFDHALHAALRGLIQAATRPRQLWPLSIGLLLVLEWLPGEASAAPCGSTALASRHGRGNSLAKHKREVSAPPPSQHS
jgi:hypothetical protein